MDRAFRTLLFTKFNSVLKYKADGEEKKSVLLQPRTSALRTVSERRGSSELEFTSYWRDEFIFDWDRNLTSAARQGISFEYGKDSDPTFEIVTAIPLKLRYNVWYWTMYPDKLNEFIETYLWWQHTNPNFEINYNDKFPLEIDLHFSSLKDESTVDTQYTEGQYFVVNGSIVLDTWLFKLASFNSIIETIVLKIFDKDSLSTSADYITVTVPEDETYDEELHDALLMESVNITETT